MVNNRLNVRAHIGGYSFGKGAAAHEDRPTWRLHLLQESIMDFYWHYSSKELIDPAGKANFFNAIGVASQVFNTLSEVIQGPCTQNQQALAHSRYLLNQVCKIQAVNFFNNLHFLLITFN